MLDLFLNISINKIIVIYFMAPMFQQAAKDSGLKNKVLVLIM